MKKQFSLLMMILVSISTSAQNFLWAKNASGSSFEEARSMVLDASGNIYYTGIFQSSVDFDPGTGTTTLTSAGSQDVFISKFDASGNFLWAKKIGGTGGDFGLSIAVDGSGNTYTTGYFRQTVDFNPGTGTNNITSAGDQDIFILKLDASGNFVWVKSIGAVYTEIAYSIALDASGNIYTTGYFQGTVDFDPGAGTSNMTTDNGNIFVSKLDASGNFAWAKQMGGDGDDRGFSIAIDGSGNVLTTGYYLGTGDFDPGTGTSNLTSLNNTEDIFISKLDASGNFVWAKSISGSLDDEAFSINVDGSGNVYTTGYYRGTADFDPGAGTSNLSSSLTSNDIFISKLNASGNFVWARGIAGSGNDAGRSISVNSSGVSFITGSFEGTIDLDPGAGSLSATSAGKLDLLILKLDAGGNLVWAKSMGGTGDDDGRAIATDDAGTAYIAGSFTGTVDFDPGPETSNLTAKGSTDIFIMKLGSLCDISINNQPKDQSGNVNATIKFTMTSTGQSPTYQWQQNTGSGFTNISNGGQYQGANNDTLNISGIQMSQNNHKFRCIAKGASCSDTSDVVTLTVKINSIGSLHNEMAFAIYPNPANNSITIQSNFNQNIPYAISDQTGRIILRGKLNSKASTIDINHLERGFYLISVGESNVEIHRLLKL